MDRVFVDTNIVLDLLQKRENFYIDAQELFTLANEKQIELYVSALTIANIHYILQKHLKMEARKVLSNFKELVNILPLDDNILSLAINSSITDFEDAIQFFTATNSNIELIITRNKKDFIGLPILVYSANEYLKLKK